jgi:hypothetical protein
MAEISNRAVATAAGGALLAVALAFVSNADASHQYDTSVRCNGQTVRQVQLVTRSSEGAVFRKLKSGPGGRKVSVAYGCLLRSGAVRRLDFANRVDDAQLAGRYVAFKHIDYVSEFGSASSIRVVDLRTGTTAVDARGVPGAGSDSHVMSLVVKRNGSVAWTGMADESGSEVSVLKVDTTTDGPRLLDSGAQIDYESLALGADRLSVGWRNGAEQKTAPLD